MPFSRYYKLVLMHKRLFSGPWINERWKKRKEKEKWKK